MERSLRFGFDSHPLTPTSAHHGVGRIHFRRVATKHDGRAFDFLDFAVVPPGCTIGDHTHAPDNEELYVILGGRAVMTLDGERFYVAPGDVVVNRPGGTHGLRNHGNVDVRLVVIQIPVLPSKRPDLL